jgi:hypothetical protein
MEGIVMLKVWRGKTTLFAECTECGSYGTAPHLQVKQKLSPVLEEALERHTSRMMALRAHYTTAANEVVRQINAGSLSRNDGTAKIRTLYENHVAQVMLGQASLPSQEGQIKELAATCPWCGKGEEVEIEQLPPDKSEPDFTQAVEVAAYIAQNMAKRK